MRNIFSAILLGLFVVADAAPADDLKPNFLFVMVDDMAPDALFGDRFPFLKTPNLDRLASEGAVFENMLVTTSLCAPSRASILTGAYAHVHGVRNNHLHDPDPSLEQFPQTLQKSGYKTAMIGKWHMGNHGGPRKGFDYWLSFKGQGSYNNPELNEDGVKFRAEGYMTDILTEKTVKFLAENTQDPFCVLLWHKACHASFTPAPRHANAFPDAQLKKPESWSLDFADRPRWLRRGMQYGVHYHRWLSSVGKPVKKTLPAGTWDPTKKKSLNMLRCLLAVDEGLGVVMKQLEKQNRLDNTVIIFMADNGWFFGEHRRGDKRLAYEESIRVPFAIRYPTKLKAGKRIQNMVSNIDIGPTLLDLAGVPVPQSMQGESFVPVIEGKAKARKLPFFYEYFQEKYAPGIPTMLAIRTPEWKYISYPYESIAQGNHGELYNLTKDPNELRNLIHSPQAAAQLEKMKAMLETAKKTYRYTDPTYQFRP